MLIIRVLFVCLGNICRSPMAEAIFKKLVEKEGLENQIHVDSAGTGSLHIGEQPHKGTRKLLDKQLISYEGIKARQIKPQDFSQFDYVIAMDDENISDLQGLQQKNTGVKLAKLLDFAESPNTRNVPDPYLTGNFDDTFELVLSGCKGLLQSIKNENKLS